MPWQVHLTVEFGTGLKGRSSPSRRNSELSSSLPCVVGGAALLVEVKGHEAEPAKGSGVPVCRFFVRGRQLALTPSLVGQVDGNAFLRAPIKSRKVSALTNQATPFQLIASDLSVHTMHGDAWLLHDLPFLRNKVALGQSRSQHSYKCG
jgi:hypothetical protein